MTVFDADLGLPGAGDPVVISALEFDVLWQHLGLQDMPVVLTVSSPGATYTAREELVRSAWTSLEAKGYGGAVGLDPRLCGMLAVLERPDTEVDGRWFRDGEDRVLAAIRDGHAVLATLKQDTLTMREAAATGLTREALAMLPPARAGSGSSVTLPSADFDTAARDAITPDAFEGALRERGVRADDAQRLRLMIGDLRGHGQFGAAARDRWGARHRARHVVSFFDTEQGRYVQVRRDSGDGQPWSTISPADPRRLRQHVDAMYAEVTAATPSGM